MSEIATWMLEQIADDEAQAALAAEGGAETSGIEALADVGFAGLSITKSRVLTECAAKRAVIYLRQSLDSLARQGGDEATSARDARAAIDGALLALALPYADREGYDEAWRP